MFAQGEVTLESPTILTPTILIILFILIGMQGPPQLVCDESRGHQDTDEQHRADAVLVVAVSPDHAAEGEGAVVRSTRLWQARFLGFTYCCSCNLQVI